MSPDETARAVVVLQARFVHFYQALTAVGLWPEPVDETSWAVHWSYQGIHLWVLDPEDRHGHPLITA